MARLAWMGCLVLALGGVAGCASGPLAGNLFMHDPVRRAGGGTLVVGDTPECDPAAECNPLWVPQRPEAYAFVFDKTYDVVNEYFDICYSNRFAGEIRTCPLMTAGYFDGFGLRLGWYDHYELLESTLQTIRRTCFVLITPAVSGGYHIDVQVLKELEDLPRPQHASAGAAILRVDNPIERTNEFVTGEFFMKGWIPYGRDHALEQVILRRLKECL